MQPDLFNDSRGLPAGFRYQPEVISPAEECDLIARFGDLPFDLLRGPSRTEWEHSIPAVDTLRYSATFRSMAEDAR